MVFGVSAQNVLKECDCLLPPSRRIGNICLFPVTYVISHLFDVQPTRHRCERREQRVKLKINLCCSAPANYAAQGRRRRSKAVAGGRRFWEEISRWKRLAGEKYRLSQWPNLPSGAA